MIRHLFITKTVKELITLRGDLQDTLRNPKCEILTTPVNNTIGQINAELEKRGIGSLKTNAEILKIMA